MFSKRSLYALFSATMISSALFFTACEEETPVTPDTTPAAPTGLMALAVNDTTVRIKWTASTSESNSNFKDYSITAVGSTGTLNFAPTAKGETIVNLSGLKKGEKYTISVIARSTTLSSTAATVEAAGATRMTGKLVYETASTQGSGLRLSDGANLTVASGGEWDLCLDSRIVNGVDNIAFGSPAASTYTDENGRFTSSQAGGAMAKATLIFSNGTNPNYTPAISDADSLNQIFDTQAIGTGKTGVQIMVENLQDRTKGVVFYGKTASNNYFKAHIKATGGKILQGTAPNRYVDIDYSYQTQVGVPHALLQRLHVLENAPIIKMKVPTTK